MSYPSNYPQQRAPNQQYPAYPPQASAPPQQYPYPQQPRYPQASPYPQGPAYTQSSAYPQGPAYHQGPAYPQGQVYPPGPTNPQGPQKARSPYPAQSSEQVTGHPHSSPTSNTSRNMDAMEMQGNEFAFSDKSVRRGFIRKVYFILTLQLIITFGIVTIFAYVDQVKQYVHGNDAFFWSIFGTSFAVFIVLVCVPNLRRKTPFNFIFLFLFTVLQGLLLGTTAAYITDPNDVVKAIVTTIVIVVVLTLFSLQTKIDFTILAGVLVSLTFGLIMFGFMALIFGGDTMMNFYCALGAILFSVYIVVDTQLMLGEGHKLAISPEEYIFAALNLYLDVINLFLFLLRLFGN